MKSTTTTIQEEFVNLGDALVYIASNATVPQMDGHYPNYKKFTATKIEINGRSRISMNDKGDIEPYYVVTIENTEGHAP